MPRASRMVLAPLAAGSTYRRYVHLLLGAVIALPYLGLVSLFVVSVTAGGIDVVAFVIMVPLAVAAAVAVLLVPGVRALAVTAAVALLGAAVPEPDPATADAWPARRRAAAWVLVNAGVGALVALATLVVVPTAVGFLIAPWRPFAGLPTGWRAAWLPLCGLLLPVVLVHVVAVVGAGLARLAPRLLGPSPTERLVTELATAERAGRALAERNRLARELHDSVGHALTVTTLQAGAAARVLETDPAFVARALDAIAEAGRAALDDLDHVLGLLRDGGADAATDRGRQPDLDDIGSLLAGTRAAGVAVDAAVHGSTGSVPGAVSREGYRIVQEGLTNALRHAGPVPVAVRVRVTPEAVELELTNPLAEGSPARRVGGGRGLAGMRERVGVLGGELSAGPDGENWRVAARLPLGGRG